MPLLPAPIVTAPAATATVFWLAHAAPSVVPGKSSKKSNTWFGSAGAAVAALAVDGHLGGIACHLRPRVKRTAGERNDREPPHGPIVTRQGADGGVRCPAHSRLAGIFRTVVALGA